ncbi:hypothetical protein OPU71_10205 [Niveibacterium sp. 24ML]|uniref:hypothetical protein n=1 Tax=Niveibacterium sp. 24ML TaxID=2985512 RepID=UPI00226F496F|nr:hypothetical protein [Niveibacterium sp. 24ML]MCX9156493.1 hypothetical protein [Niveibacterium sp. 24ML]
MKEPDEPEVVLLYRTGIELPLAGIVRTIVAPDTPTFVAFMCARLGEQSASTFMIDTDKMRFERTGLSIDEYLALNCLSISIYLYQTHCNDIADPADAICAMNTALFLERLLKHARLEELSSEDIRAAVSLSVEAVDGFAALTRARAAELCASIH